MAPWLLGDSSSTQRLAASPGTPRVYGAPGVTPGAQGPRRRGRREALTLGNPVPLDPELPAFRHGDLPPPRLGGTRVAHSPSSSCLGASFAGSRGRGRRWHLASRILKRAFCRMRVAGAPGESPTPPGGGLSCGQGGGGPGAGEGVPEGEGLRGDQVTGSWGMRTSASFSLAEKARVWTVGSRSRSSLGPSSQRSSVEAERQASRSSCTT